MSPLALEHYLVLSALLFAIGMAGLVLRRDALAVFMALEINLNAANLAAVAFAHFNGHLEGQVLVFFIIAIAAAEVAVGLAIVMALYRHRRSVNLDELDSMRE